MTTNRQAPLFAIRVGAVAGGWDGVCRSIHSSHRLVQPLEANRVSGSRVPDELLPDAPVWTTHQLAGARRRSVDRLPTPSHSDARRLNRKLGSWKTC